MKHWFDENAKERNFKPSDRVLALLPVPEKPLRVKSLTLQIKKIMRKQKHLCHANMLKQYIDRDSSSVTPTNVVGSVPQEQSEMNSEDMYLIKSDPASSKRKNSDIPKDLDKTLSHIDPVQRNELKVNS